MSRVNIEREMKRRYDMWHTLNIVGAAVVALMDALWRTLKEPGWRDAGSLGDSEVAL